MNFVKEYIDYRRVIVFLGLAAFFVLSGPYGTFNLPLNTRASYWISWLVVTLLPMMLVYTILNHHPKLKHLNIWYKDLATLILGIPLAAAAGIFVGHQFFPSFLITFDNYLSESQFQSPMLIGFVAILHLTQTPPVPKPEIEKLHDNEFATNPRFFERIPRHLGDDLLSLSVSDHYIEIKTAKGDHLELVSLTKAIEELENFAGFRIHRSHWVAKHAIAKKQWQGSRLFVILTDGTKLPVSRSFHKNLAAF